eukprot:359060-Chlamydomonas_euryale.AAC.5
MTCLLQPKWHRFCNRMREFGNGGSKPRCQLPWLCQPPFRHPGYDARRPGTSQAVAWVLQARDLGLMTAEDPLQRKNSYLHRCLAAAEKASNDRRRSGA